MKCFASKGDLRLEAENAADRAALKAIPAKRTLRAYRTRDRNQVTLSWWPVRTMLGGTLKVWPSHTRPVFIGGRQYRIPHFGPRRFYRRWVFNFGRVMFDPFRPLERPTADQAGGAMIRAYLSSAFGAILGLFRRRQSGDRLMIASGLLDTEPIQPAASWHLRPGSVVISASVYFQLCRLERPGSDHPLGRWLADFVVFRMGPGMLGDDFVALTGHHPDFELESIEGHGPPTYELTAHSERDGSTRIEARRVEP